MPINAPLVHPLLPKFMNAAIAPLTASSPAIGRGHVSSQSVCSLLVKTTLIGALAVVPAWAHAASSVQLAGVSSGKALLVIDQQPPRFVTVGETVHGVTLQSVQGQMVSVTAEGKTFQLEMGRNPVVLSPGAGKAGKIVLKAETNGHFIARGTINDQPVNFMVDTGATMLALGSNVAQSLGIKLDQLEVIPISTAGGVVKSYKVKLKKVRIGEIEFLDMDAVISSSPMPYVLLGNNFLNRFQMRKENDQMTLEQRF